MIDVVYFSSVSGQTERFVRKLGLDRVHKIPLRRGDGELRVDSPYVLITPTYGAGNGDRPVPPQVIRFLNNEGNRSMIRGVVGGGNRNYGKFFCYASEVVSKKCSVPLIGKFEVFGLPGEAEEIREAIDKIG